MPGLVNAHVHLELSALNPGQRPPDFITWLKRLLPRTPPDAQAIQSFVTRGVEIGVKQCLQFGVTSVGDISLQCAITRPLLKASPLRVVSYGEVQAMAQRRGRFEEKFSKAVDATASAERLRIGISPHAPYSVEPHGYRRCLAAARSSGFPIATHLAETRDEETFLADHTGPFRDLWAYLDAWDEDVPTFAGGPIRFAASLGLLDHPTLLAHVNYCDDHEMAMLGAGRASVVYCPRTHAYFGHPPHRWRDMLAAGINVAVGTDSCASSPDLNLVDDLRLLREIAPDVPAIDLWKMGTLNAARAIEWQDHIGSIAPGKSADLTAFAAGGDDPLQEILESKKVPVKIWIEGRPVNNME